MNATLRITFVKSSYFTRKQLAVSAVINGLRTNSKFTFSTLLCVKIILFYSRIFFAKRNVRHKLIMLQRKSKEEYLFKRENTFENLIFLAFCLSFS